MPRPLTPSSPPSPGAEPAALRLAAVRIAATHIRYCRDWPCRWRHVRRACRAALALRQSAESALAASSSERVLARALDTATAIAARSRRETVTASIRLLIACDAVDHGKDRLEE